MNLQLFYCSSPLLPLPIYYRFQDSHYCLLLHSWRRYQLSSRVCYSSKSIVAAANNQVSSSSGEGKLASELLDDKLLDRLSAAKDAEEVLLLVAEERKRAGDVVSASDCRLIISAALDRGNAELALSVFSAMRSSFDSGSAPAERSMDIPAWKRGLQFLQLMKPSIPAAVHSIVVQTPSGKARTHRFATETANLPAQKGERVTVAVAAPLTAYREVGPLKLSTRIPNFYPGEPMCLTNHKDGRESRLLRAPSKDEGKSMLSPSTLFPILALIATGDAASGIVDPILPQLIAVAAISSVAVGVTVNGLILPQLNKLPQRSVDINSIRQQLLSQYDVLQSRIKELKKATENEVWILARMCQLENKTYAVGERAYLTRRNRVKKVREGLESSLKNRIDLIESYARLSSMIEIEVELELDAVAAEAVSNSENIAEQIQQIMEIENLEEKWRQQAEANDEAERLLRSEPTSDEQASYW